MPRTALPQNYILNEGTTLEAFDSLTGWTNNDTTKGTMELDDTHHVPGRSNSLRVNITTAGQPVRITKQISFKRNRQSFWDLWVYSTYTNTNHETQLTLSVDAGFSKIFYKSWIGIMKGWNRFRVHFDDMVPTGSPSWTTDTITYLRIRTFPATSTTPSISYNNLNHSVEREGLCMITFDDYYPSVYTEAFAYMNPLGLKGTLYAITDLINTPSKITTAQLREMYNAGWAISNHTSDHTDLTTLTTEQIQTKINDANTWLTNNGFIRSKDHLSYPGGAFNQTVLDALPATSIKTARTTQQYYNSGAPQDHYLMRSVTLGNTLNLSTAKIYIDYAVKHGVMINLTLHNLVTTPTNISEWGISDFKALIKYICAKGLRCVTIDEWYNGLTNPRYRSGFNRTPRP